MKILLHIEGEKVISARIVGKRAKTIESTVKAQDFLKTLLTKGPAQALTVMCDARKLGISRDKLYAASRELGVRKFPGGHRASYGWTWELRKDDKQTNMAHDASGDAGSVDAQAALCALFPPCNHIKRGE